MTAAIHTQVEHRLAEHDVRYTRGRRAVVSMLSQADGPVSAGQLAATLSDDVPLSSLYRTLSVLEDASVVVPHFATKGLARYELAEWLTGHHHHLVCSSCGTVEDTAVPEDFEVEVQRLVDEIAAISGFKASGHELEIHGICESCS